LRAEKQEQQSLHQGPAEISDRSLRVAAVERQRDEITEYHIYRRLAEIVSPGPNRDILKKIAQDELGHYEIWKKISGRAVKPSRIRILFYTNAARVLGLSFALKLMEQREKGAERTYALMADDTPAAEAILKDEQEHEAALLRLLDEERLRYIGSIVLGLNDALVELVGALAGLTLALRNARLIALSGLVTGIAAALSMAASEFLSIRAEGEGKHPVRAAFYTGSTYLTTVGLLILPYLFLQNYFLSLGITLLTAILIIWGFTYYVSVAQEKEFGSHFAVMAGLSLGVAAISFVIGLLVRHLLGVEV